MEIYKLGRLVAQKPGPASGSAAGQGSPKPPEPEFEPQRYGNVWMREKVGAVERLVLGPARDQCGLIIDLARPLAEPFGLMYVALYPHFGHPRGRYKAKEPIGRARMEKFFRDYAEFFELDGRHNIWVVSLDAGGQAAARIIYDHHDVIYAYGPLDAYVAAAAKRGMAEGKVEVPRDHRHVFNQQFNKDERNLFEEREWVRFPTEESDY